MDYTVIPTEISGKLDVFPGQAGFLAYRRHAAKQGPTKSPDQVLADMGFEEDPDSCGTRFVRDGTELALHLDDCPQNPRDAELRLGKIVLHPKSDYDFGDERGFEVPENAVLAYPLYAHVHGDITLAFDPTAFYDAPFDTGILGFVYTTREHMDKYGCHQDISKDEIRKIFESEIQTMNHYLAGHVFYYVIQDMDGEDPDGVGDSCGGFYGIDDALDYAIHMVKCHDKKALKAERAAVVYP